MTRINPVILCGGAGTRLWPMSREQFPKQLLRLSSDEHSLLQATMHRVTQNIQDNIQHASMGACVVVSNEHHRFLVAEQIQEAGIDTAKIILEPVGRNTAPALTLAALTIINKQDDGLMLVMPADHVIQQVASFQQAVNSGIAWADQDYLVTFGVVPTHAETGYGYLKLGSALDQNKSAYAIQQFVEKPDKTTAESYSQSGDYLWNSGMFLIKASTWLNALKEYRLDIFESVQQAFEAGRDDYDFYRVDEKLFKATPSESIDYAVMEQLTEKENAKFKGAIIPLDAGWSDVGSWQSIWDIGVKDASGNVRSGDVFLHDSQNSLIMAESRIVAGIGLENIVIVETPDAVMVANKNNSQNVKDIVTQLKAEKRDEALFHRKVYRPWGSYQGVDAGERYQVKHIEVKPGASLSLQMHHHRAEHWIVVSGTARVTRGEEEFILSENESTYIPLGVTHRLENPGTIPLKIIEVQSGTYLGEDDIVRFEDKYGRREP